MDTLRHLAAHLALDLAAVCLLVFRVYHPRHGRRELVPSLLALNVGLFTVVQVLAGAGGGHGGTSLGLGLFGVLSLVRLRSDAVQQEEIAYYFTAMVLGLLCALPHLSLPAAAGLSAVLLLVVQAADHPRLLAGSRRALVTLDTAYGDPAALRADLARRLGEPLRWTVVTVDFVRDLTVVDVRYRESRPELPAGYAPRPLSVGEAV
ncbi:DUF4956 domain-containing protein [Streptomyces sp. URMC 126]|uniref:DUF4956 domain-containing protein n=1 Tax=Streptomyces sp. URMC 126 TaxID=3423401 RepID=UPI003F1A9432